jgi:hypothetical protein
LEEHGDHVNAAHARHLQVRRLLLLGHIDEAERALGELDAVPLPPASRAAHELTLAGIAMRRLQSKAARAALERATRAAHAAGIPALAAEVESAAGQLRAPAARLVRRGEAKPLLLEDVEAVLASGALVVDELRHTVRSAGREVPLATRPVLFVLVRALAESWPADAGRDELVARAFRAKRADESYRARLRVEMARLRKELGELASIEATPRGFALTPRHSHDVLVLARPVEERHAPMLAFLSDGELWSSSALALALGTSQRSVQRALDELAAAGKVRAIGRARARRWMAPALPGITTTLLLPAPLLAG